MRSILLASLILVGCAQNPADNKPAATVSNSTSTPAAAPVGTTPTRLPGNRYAISPENSKVEFVGSKVTGSHDGGFKKFSGQIGLIENDPTRSAVQIDIDATSVYSDDEKLTEHLKSKDFFEIDQFPQASFRSTAITKDGDHFKLTGDLTLHGVTKQISFPAEILTAADSVQAKAEFSINRNDFGIVYKGKADNLIRPEVVIKLDLNAKPAN